MSENNNEAEALFATKRKMQQEEEARQHAADAEKKRLEELELQKRQMAEEIRRLENLQNIQAMQNMQAPPQKAQNNKKVLIIVLACVLGVLFIAGIVVLAIVLNNPTGGGGTVTDNKPLQSTSADIGEDVTSDAVSEDDSHGEVVPDAQGGFTELLEQSVWETVECRVPEYDFVTSFRYPVIFSKENVEDDVTIYTYTDEASQQKLLFDIMVVPNDDPFDIDYSITDVDSLEMLIHLMFSEFPEAEVNRFDENNVYIIADRLDDIENGKETMISFMGLKENLFVAATFYLTKEAEGTDRLIDTDDVLYLYRRLYDSIPLG